MRPEYESAEDRAREAEVATLIAAKWNCTLHKMSIKYCLDYAAVRDGYVVAFCEVKARSYSWAKIDEMGGYLMSLGKWMMARELSTTTKLPFILAVVATDGVWYRIYKDFFPPPILFRGRTDRDDWQDVEPCVLLNCHEFKRL